MRVLRSFRIRGFIGGEDILCTAPIGGTLDGMILKEMGAIEREVDREMEGEGDQERESDRE